MRFPYFGRRPKTGFLNLSKKKPDIVDRAFKTWGAPTFFRRCDESAPAKSPYEQDAATGFGSQKSVVAKF